ncbi:hypothetical protein [Protaetiibacter intestinalis]|uniref:Uncharacterized protein n=1 Tax=Protaetiibacter intestinalis TaxID=2419774 RepID=A0A387B5C4_9MICO|nr:hypothetical protein [Protaetiibacter intestinalis]AYF97603.1 hypothetical protein D7I47_04550 [Protaetiibacter intestinalis]
MTPRWIRPVVAATSALALGAGALYLGTLFAAPETVTVATGTESVVVAEPIVIGDEPIPAADEQTPDEDDETPDATRTVRVPAGPVDASARLDPSVAELVDTLAASPDPAYELTVIGGSDDGGTGGGTDDACAPRDGEPATDCPEGLRSTVLPLVREYLWGTVTAFPPSGVNGSRLTGCSPEVVDPPEGETPFGVVANAPARFQLRYQPVDGSVAPRVVELSTPDDQRAAYQAAIAAGADDATTPVNAFCFTIPELQPDTVYTAQLTGTSDAGAEMVPYPISFNTAGAPTRPSLRLTPVGENLLLATALRTQDQSLDIRAFEVDADAPPSCDAGTALSPAARAESSVDPDRLLELNVLPEYHEQHAATFRVSPGATLVVCARWFDASDDSASWERTQPIYTSTIVAQSPDRLVPSLEIADWHDGSGLDVESVRLEVATAEGASCHSAEWSADDPITTPRVLCTASFLDGSGVHVEGDRMWDLGFSGDLVVRGRVTLPTGYSEDARLLPAVDGDCRGACPIPEDRVYRMQLAGVTIDLRESWTLGGGNGRSDWEFTTAVDESPAYVVPELPQLDIDSVWTSSAPNLSGTVTMTLDLMVDRPVDYVVLISEELGVGFPNCSGTGLMEVRGHAEAGHTPVRIYDVCMGLYARSQVELTDAAGHSVVWGLFDSRAWWGPNSLVRAATLERDIRYRVDGSVWPNARLQTFELWLGGTDTELVNLRGGECTGDGLPFDEGTAEVGLGSETRYHFQLQVWRFNGRPPDDCADDIGTYIYAPAVDVEGTFALADLARPDGVVLELHIPDEGTIFIHLWM